jgi:hypothetical protein
MAFGCLILLLAASLAAAPTTDISGKWGGRTFMAPSGSETPLPITLTFKVEGDKLTGALSSPRGNYEIIEGKIGGDSVTFSALVGAGNNRLKMLFDGRITADGIDFISKFAGGDRSDHFIAKRLPE